MLQFYAFTVLTLALTLCIVLFFAIRAAVRDATAEKRGNTSRPCPKCHQFHESKHCPSYALAD